MASLALVVGLMFLFSIMSGPLSYLLSKFSWIPKVFVWILAILNIGIGVWWILLPIGFVKYIGLSNICFGILILQKKT